MLADQSLPIDNDETLGASEDIAAELSFLLEALAGATAIERTEVAELELVSEALEDAKPRERYQPLGPVLAKAAVASVATFPAVIVAAPSFANEPLPVNMMLAMAERPKVTPGMGATGTQLFPFSRPMQSVSAQIAADPGPAPQKIKLPLNPRIKAMFAESKPTTVTTKRHAEVKLYKVAKGDSLYAIAARVLGSGARWREIYQANKHKIASTYLLMPGTQLVIPTPRQVAPVATAAKPAAPKPAAAKVAAAKANGHAYQVEKGDSLYVIAAKKLGDPLRWREILALNKSALQGSTVIYPNQWLLLPTFES